MADMMKDLLDACRNDKESLKAVSKARNALIDFTFERYKTAHLQRIGNEYVLPDFNPAIQAVKMLNKICVCKGISRVFSGEYNVKPVAAFAEALTMNVLNSISRK